MTLERLRLVRDQRIGLDPHPVGELMASTLHHEVGDGFQFMRAVERIPLLNPDREALGVDRVDPDDRRLGVVAAQRLDHDDRVFERAPEGLDALPFLIDLDRRSRSGAVAATVPAAVAAAVVCVDWGLAVSAMAVT